MSKLIAAINMTLDGFCDHTAVTPDEETHQHFSDLLRSAGTLVYGRITYKMMEDYWPEVLKNPTGIKSTNDFAVSINDIDKIVYSRTLKSVVWKNSTLKKEIDKKEIEALKQAASKPILVGSPSLIIALANLDLIDQFQFLIHPCIVGSGLPLFKNIKDRLDLTLVNTKIFKCGAVNHYYEPVKK